MTYSHHLIGVHSDYLEARAVRPEQAQARGYRTVGSGKPAAEPETFAAHYGFPRTTSGLLMPFYDVTGQPCGYQIRLDQPRDGNKFLTPKGQPSHLLGAPGLTEALAAQGQVVWILEGITRQDAIAAYSIPSIAMPGAWNWRGRNNVGGYTALADWESVNVRDSIFAIGFDGDVNSNKDVFNAYNRLAKMLRGRGAARVMLVKVPDGLGLDDYIAGLGIDPAGGAAAQKLVVEALHELIVDDPDSPALVKKRDAARRAAKDPGGAWKHGVDSGDIEAAERLIDSISDALAVYSPASAKNWRILTPRPNGTWVHADAKLGALVAANERKFADMVTVGGATEETLDSAKRSRELARDSRHIARVLDIALGYAIERKLAGQPVGVGRVVTVPTRGGRMQAVAVQDLDPPGYLACADCIVDLRSGRRLDGDEGRATLQTRAAPWRYVPDADPKLYLDLFFHVDPPIVDYYLGHVGHALHGQPKGMIWLVGKTQSGKTTANKHVGAAVGMEIGGRMPPGLLVPAKAHNVKEIGAPNPERLPWTNKRLLIHGEIDRGVRLNQAYFKAITGGEGQSVRGLWEREFIELRTTATGLASMNYEDLAQLLMTTDKADRHRLHIIDWPELPEADIKPQLRDLPDVGGPDLRPRMEALLAALIKAAVRYPDEPPPEDAAVTATTDRVFREQHGELGEWARASIVPAVGGFGGGYVDMTAFLSSTAAYEAAKADYYEEKPFGLDQKPFTEAIREALNLPPAVPKKVNGIFHRVWKGYRLVPTEERAGRLEGPADTEMTDDLARVHDQRDQGLHAVEPTETQPTNREELAKKLMDQEDV